MGEPRARRRRRERALQAIIAGALWFIATRYLDRGVADLLPYAAPAAIAGLTVGWVAHAFARRRFDWDTGAEAALAGALYLTPFIGAFVVVSTAFSAEIMLLVFTLGAWVMLIVALAGGALLYIGRTVRQPGRRRRVAARARRVYRRLRRSQKRRRTLPRPASDADVGPNQPHELRHQPD